MRRILILGAGFGGLAAANELRARLPDSDEVVIVDRKSTFVMGLRKWWALVGRGTLEQGRRDLATLLKRGIQFRQGAIDTLDPARRVAVVDGKPIEADAVIVALGAQHAMEAIPGLAPNAPNLYDVQAIPGVAEAVRTFQGGRIGIGIFGAPYTCPPAPYELALLLRDALDRRGLEAEIEVFTPQSMSLPVLGQANCSTVEGLLEGRRIGFLPNHRALSVEPGVVRFATGPRAYDLLLAVPPHHCPAVLRDAGLAAAGGWVRVDPATMATSFPGVYAIGDTTEIPLANGMPLPKAGVFAEAGAKVAAEAILAGFSGGASSQRFDGYGYCYLESGRGEALEVRGNFLAEPAPQVNVEPPSADRLRAKESFERERLERWFGD